MRFRYLVILRSLEKFQVPWKIESIAKVAVVGLVIILAASVLFKPRMNSEVHADYLANLNQMVALSGEQYRDHLLVSQDLVGHHDFLEADLEKMERSAELALLAPNFVSADYDLQLAEVMSAYQSAVSKLRTEIETSQRSVDLLTNARRALRQSLGDINTAMTADVTREAMVLISELEYALVYNELDEDWLQKADQLETLMPSAADTLQSMMLQARTINVLQIELAEASKRMYVMLDSMSQPETMKLAYLEEFHSTIIITDRLAWLNHTAVAMLLAVFLGLSWRYNKARETAQEGAVLAQQTQLETDRWLIQTHLAVTQCNEVLESIGRGEFEHRLEFPFDESLEVLRESINQTADSVEFTMSELSRVMLAVKEGRFDVRLDSRVEGTLGLQVDETISSLDTAIADICQVMDDMRDGCFSTRVGVDCMGRLDELKNSVNDSMSVLDGAISDVVGLVRHQAEGDFTRTIKVTGKGQLELLATSINSSSAKVHEMVHEIRQVSATVELSSESMKGNSRTWCEHTAFHSDSVSSLLKKVDLVKTAIQTNCKSVANATVLVGRSQEEAGKGLRIANEAVGFMQNINEKSLKIATISGVLDTIARQTNLLALNAAVEAVRAGERGAGFSVVAGEVKDLARQSAAASTDITALITATMHDIRLGSESVENTGRALQAISASILDVEKISKLIVDQSNGQEDDMDGIVSIVNQTRQIIMEDLELAQGINDTSENLGVLVQRVNQLLSFFQTDNMNAETLSEDDVNQAALAAEECAGKAA